MRDQVVLHDFSRPAWPRRLGNVRTTVESEIDIGGKWLFARAAPKALTSKRAAQRLCFRASLIHSLLSELQSVPVSFLGRLAYLGPQCEQPQ
jgi:hypothetical protein